MGIAHDITERIQSYEKLQKTLTGTINAISVISEIRDPYTSGHQKIVAKLAATISRKLKMDEEKVNAISTAALIHDIGKISIPISILSKPTTLTDIEFAMIKTHSQLGFDITKEIEINKGKLYDPGVIDACIKLFRQDKFEF